MCLDGCGRQGGNEIHAPSKRSNGRRLSRRALLACALLLLAAPAAWAGVWLPPQDLSAPGRDATNPAVAMADDGATTAIWEKDNTANAGFHGETSTRDPGQAFTSPAELVPGVTDPQMEMTGGGQAIAVWKRLVNPPGIYVIEAAIRPPGAPPSDAPTTVAEMPAGVIPNGLQIAVNGAGDVAVVWTRPDPESGIDPDATFVEASVRPAGGAFRTRTGLAADRRRTGTAEPHLNAIEPSVAIDRRR